MSQKTGNAVSGTVNKKTRENVGPSDYIGTLRIEKELMNLDNNYSSR